MFSVPKYVFPLVFNVSVNASDENQIKLKKIKDISMNVNEYQCISMDINEYQ